MYEISFYKSWTMNQLIARTLNLCFDNLLIYSIIFQAKMPKFSLYQVLKCGDLMLFFVIHHCKLNIFRCFVVGQAKRDSTTLISDKIGQTGIFWGNNQQDQLIISIIVSCNFKYYNSAVSDTVALPCRVSVYNKLPCPWNLSLHLLYFSSDLQDAECPTSA